MNGVKHLFICINIQVGMLNAYRVFFIFQVRKNFCPSESVIFSLLNQTQKQVAKKLHKYAIQSF